MEWSASSSKQARKRKAHQKSRHGCLKCKQGHHKCDETRPTCGNCRRLGARCSFEAPTSKALSVLADGQVFAIDDMRLLHHWLKDGLLFDDQDYETVKTGRDDEMNLSFSHPYLLHAILSLAALELFHRNPTDVKLYTNASSHNLIALQHARPHVSRCDRENSAALFTFSSLASLYAFAEPPLRLLSASHAGSFDCVRDLLNAFRMGRGILAVMALNRTHLEDIGKPNRSLWPDGREEVTATLETEYPVLVALCSLVERHCRPPQTQILCKALQDLFATISLMGKRSVNHSSLHLIQTWPMHVDSLFLEMCERMDPIALIILAHYACMVHTRRNVWFFERWPSLLFRDLEERLGHEWREYLEWPRCRIFGTES
ncbi:MAG: hypothetical protein FE78DRAFT_173921 [Acidomyces sp. 'richmondensis']|nr:MAG: hypothetical protein FE78DRAFT_173921 [Acidomyces sp. 'richmondensis']